MRTCVISFVPNIGSFLLHMAVIAAARGRPTAWTAPPCVRSSWQRKYPLLL